MTCDRRQNIDPAHTCKDPASRVPIANLDSRLQGMRAGRIQIEIVQVLGRLVDWVCYFWIIHTNDFI